MKINIDLATLSEEEFINFLLYDVNNYLLNELSPILQKRQDAKKWSAALDIVRANMDLYSLYHDCDLSKLPPPEPYKVYPTGCPFD